MLKHLLALAAIASLAQPAQALTAGDLAFTAFNADEDGWSMVVLADLAPNTTVYFTDNEWGGASFNSGESYHQWVSGSGTVSAGTVIRFSAIDSSTSLSASVGTLTRASVSGSSNYGMSQSEESIFAYLASSVSATPTTFLAAISSTAFGSAAAGVLTGTGLSVGAGAIELGGGADFDQYIGDRSSQASFADYKPLVSDIANWTDNAVDGSYASVVPDTTSFSVTAVPEPETYAMLLAGLAGIGATVRRRTR